MHPIIRYYCVLPTNHQLGWPDKMVYTGQNGTDNMVGIKWYEQNGSNFLNILEYNFLNSNEFNKDT